MHPREIKRRPHTRTQTRYVNYRADQREYFDDLITNDWDDYVNAQWDRVRTFEVREIFKRIAPRTVLNVGSGSGYHDAVMAKQRNVDQVVGVDYSAESIKAAERIYPHTKVRREVADLFSLPAGAFDLAISFQVVEHLTDPAVFLEACARQVRPGGWVVALTPNRERLVNRVRRRLGLRLALEDPQHFAEYTVAELAAIGAITGLRPIGSFSYGLSFYVPHSRLQLVPQRWAHLWGYRVPSIADRFAILFQKP